MKVVKMFVKHSMTKGTSPIAFWIRGMSECAGMEMIVDSNTPVSHPSDQAQNSIQRQKSSKWEGGGGRAIQRWLEEACLRMAPGDIQDWVMSLWTKCEVAYLQHVCASRGGMGEGHGPCVGRWSPKRQHRWWRRQRGWRVRAWIAWWERKMNAMYLAGCAGKSWVERDPQTFIQ
jgi:hypothetical protein